MVGARARVQVRAVIYGLLAGSRQARGRELSAV